MLSVLIKKIMRKTSIILKILPFFFLIACLTYVWTIGGWSIQNQISKTYPSVESPSDLRLSDGLPISLLSKLIHRLNSREFILNHERFPALASNDTVLVVQVHKRIEYLKALIESLRNAQGINRTLLIFSHDNFNPKINYFIQSINFTKVTILDVQYNSLTHSHFTRFFRYFIHILYNCTHIRFLGKIQKIVQGILKSQSK